MRKKLNKIKFHSTVHEAFKMKELMILQLFVHLFLISLLIFSFSAQEKRGKRTRMDQVEVGPEKLFLIAIFSIEWLIKPKYGPHFIAKREK
jgi:hypothetical protein